MKPDRLYSFLPLSVARWIATVWYLQPRQIAWRLGDALRRRFTAARGAAAHGALEGATKSADFRPRNLRSPGMGVLAEAASFRFRHDGERHVVDGGRLRFLNQVLELDWHAVEADQTIWIQARDRHLWLFHYHYHAWVPELILLGRPEAALAAMGAWADNYRLGDPGCFRAPWAPYCVARRLVNWLSAVALLAREDPAFVLPPWLKRTLEMQVIFLFRHLEWQHGGNHLLANLLALRMAGLLFAGPWMERLVARVERILEAELRHQILPHGLHYERAGSYTELVREDIGLLQGALHVEGRSPAFLRDAHHRVCTASYDLLLATREVPLLGDSVRGRRLAAGEADPPFPTVQLVDEHIVYRDAPCGIGLLADFGPLAPDELMAHAHDDLFGFELVMGGQLVVCDGGAGVYREGISRTALRSAREHAVLTVNGQGSCDPWKSFRAGRRGHPLGPLDFRRTADGWEARRRHDGFRLLGLEAERFIAVRGTTVIVEDRLRPLSRWHTRPPWTVRSHLPLHPAVRFTEEAPGRVAFWHRRSGGLLGHAELEGPVGTRILPAQRGRRWHAFGAFAHREIVIAVAPMSAVDVIQWSFTPSARP